MVDLVNKYMVFALEKPVGDLVGERVGALGGEN